MDDFYERVNELLSGAIPFIAVTLVDTTGSAPGEAGSKMLVSAEGLYYGTVGGGKVEKRAIEEALSLLNAGDSRQKTHFVNWSLEKDIGMTCGGLVKLFFEKHNCESWNIVVFGAGHVANALISLLLKLDCRITCIDPRSDWLEKLPNKASLSKVLCENMPAYVAKIPENSFVLLMTMGHSSDKPILIEILRKRRFPYTGVIGSKAKALRLQKDIVESGLPPEKHKEYFCPVGLPFGSNHPQEIAFSIVAQLLQERDRLSDAKTRGR